MENFGNNYESNTQEIEQKKLTVLELFDIDSNHEIAWEYKEKIANIINSSAEEEKQLKEFAWEHVTNQLANIFWIDMSDVLKQDQLDYEMAA